MKRKIFIYSSICMVLLLIIRLTTACNDDDSPADSSPTSGSPFDLDTALELGRLSLQAYQMLTDFEQGKTFTLPSPYQLVVQILTPEAFEGEPIPSEPIPIAFIAKNDDNIYVVFRGTKTIVEWIDDAMFAQVPYTFVDDGGMTEQGFTNIYGTIHDSIVNAVNNLSSTGTFSNLFITGHSLGAALAILAVPELTENTSFKNPIMYNFAGPRVGNIHFVNELYNPLNITSWRVVNTNDVVPTLPPTTVIIIDPPEVFFYEHVNSEEAITFGNPISGPFDFTDIEFNHSMCNYYNTLCDMTSDPDTCKAMADGADSCNPPSQ